MHVIDTWQFRVILACSSNVFFHLLCIELGFFFAMWIACVIRRDNHMWAQEENQNGHVYMSVMISHLYND